MALFPALDPKKPLRRTLLPGCLIIGGFHACLPSTGLSIPRRKPRGHEDVYRLIRPRESVSKRFCLRRPAQPRESFQNVLAPCVPRLQHLNEGPRVSTIAMLAQGTGSQAHMTRQQKVGPHSEWRMTNLPCSGRCRGLRCPNPLTAANKSDNPNSISGRSNRNVRHMFIGQLAQAQRNVMWERDIALGTGTDSGGKYSQGPWF